jgi:AraC-like DNA-binding protein
MGFDNPDYFSTLFKRSAGISPGEYREFTRGKTKGIV